MTKHSVSDLDVDTFDYGNCVGLLYKNKKIVSMTALEAWQLGFKLLRCARFVNKDLPRDIEL